MARRCAKVCKVHRTVLIDRWKDVCDDCFRRLPRDLRGRLTSAPRHLRVPQVKVAVRWLKEHPEPAKPDEAERARLAAERAAAMIGERQDD